MNIKKILKIVAIIIVIALLAWPKLMPTKNDKSIASQAKAKKMPTKVSIYVAQKQDLENNLHISGSIIAQDEVELHSEAQGRVTKINFDEGSQINKGQLLIKINDADLQAQLRKVISIKKLKEETEKRSKQLLIKGALSQEQYDMSLNELNSANADIDLLKENIRKTELLAPFSGIIGLKYLSEGSYITPAFTIASLHNINKVTEKYASQLKKGNEISFTTDGSDKVFTASIYAIEPKVDELTRNVVMRAACNNLTHEILPGAFANILVKLHIKPNSLMVPTQSVVPILKGQKIFVIRGDSTIEQIVKTGIRKDSQIEITEGLHVGDSVVVNGIMYLKQGSKIKIGK
ncbi:MAG: efflux RND transporter periplasmic adaptor subunit [Bacteroidetes bacterium]|nr:efflux RND transporter periplasmic adaptor subunit [Bacteroidota bacterium]